MRDSSPPWQVSEWCPVFTFILSGSMLSAVLSVVCHLILFIVFSLAWNVSLIASQNVHFAFGTVHPACSVSRSVCEGQGVPGPQVPAGSSRGSSLFSSPVVSKVWTERTDYLRGNNNNINDEVSKLECWRFNRQRNHNFCTILVQVSTNHTFLIIIMSRRGLISSLYLWFSKEFPNFF